MISGLTITSFERSLEVVWVVRGRVQRARGNVWMAVGLPTDLSGLHCSFDAEMHRAAEGHGMDGVSLSLKLEEGVA